MIISYRIMADYYRSQGVQTKALAYEKWQMNTLHLYAP